MTSSDIRGFDRRTLVIDIATISVLLVSVLILAAVWHPAPQEQLGPEIHIAFANFGEVAPAASGAVAAHWLIRRIDR